MTKRELIEHLKDVSDEATIFIAGHRRNVRSAYEIFYGYGDAEVDDGNDLEWFSKDQLENLGFSKDQLENLDGVTAILIE